MKEKKVLSKKVIVFILFVIISYGCRENEKKVTENEIYWKEVGETMATLMNWNNERIIYHYTSRKILFYLDMPVYEIKDVHTKEIIDRIVDMYSKTLEKQEDKENIGFRILKIKIDSCSNGWRSISITCRGKYPKYLFFTDLTLHEDKLKQMHFEDKSKILDYIREIGGLLVYRGFYFLVDKEFDVRGILKKTGLYVMMPITIMAEDQMPPIDDYEEFSLSFYLKKGKVRYGGGRGYMLEFIDLFENNLPDEWEVWTEYFFDCP